MSPVNACNVRSSSHVGTCLSGSGVQQFSIYHVQIVGRSDKLRQRSYAISLERKVKHPAVVAICEVARKSFT
ncbi:MAG: hypothetical protein A2341_15485 [Deltaproteobacteria bacterium RIFOXYB12_FULL_58_9]|nr:MAG: hypothetical protein A2341_15485 [Deltaproteobacteria bacterium RIFOXYB12_FULL_58_9]